MAFGLLMPAGSPIVGGSNTRSQRRRDRSGARSDLWMAGRDYGGALHPRGRSASAGPRRDAQTPQHSDEASCNGMLLGAFFGSSQSRDIARTHVQGFKPRVEDDRLVRGKARFVDDVRPPGCLAAVFVRSPHAFATIRSTDVTVAISHPGVHAVLTAADIKAAGSGNVSRPIGLVGRNAAKLKVPFRPALADGCVMHVGQPVALVIANSLAIAQEAADCVQVEYDALPPVIGVHQAIGEGAAVLWDEAPSNIAIDWPGSIDDPDNETEVQQIIAAAPHVARVSPINQRLVVASMEPRGASANFNPADGVYTLCCGSQGAGALRDEVAATLGVPTEKVVVVTDDVGGAFGMKTPLYPEYIALLVAARALQRPVHWMSSRTEAFLSDNQARDTVTEGTLALDKDGRFLALHMDVLADMGAFLSTASAFIATSNFARCLSTVYAIPRISVRIRCVFTNSVPTAPYRGAGRPEANYAVERLIEAAGKVTGINSLMLRRRNMITPQMLPYKTPVGTTIDSGNFEALLDRALEFSDYAGFPARRRQSVKRGKLRGIGVSCFLEHAGGTSKESAALTFPGHEKIVLALNVQATGQGQETVFGRLAAERLGIPPEYVNVIQGDTRLAVSLGGSSTASRSTITAGAAIVSAVETVIAKGCKTAADMLEASYSDVEYNDGSFSIKGTDRKVSLFVVAEQAAASAAESGSRETLDTAVTTEAPQTFPNGCHVAEVEVDPETGVVEVIAYTAVDDSGHLLEPVLVEGQIQGGVVQGIGQALFEQAVYDADSGQLVSGSFTDYAMPRAGDVPAIDTASYPFAATTNPLGVKGAGESGTTGSLAAIMNAISDALPGDAGQLIDMPATPSKVWRACMDGKNRLRRTSLKAYS
jgi:aerobic carbon-monoxide dehydrogenase large subunit